MYEMNDKTKEVIVCGDLSFKGLRGVDHDLVVSILIFHAEGAWHGLKNKYFNILSQYLTRLFL